MKLRQKQEDFMVEEIPLYKPQKEKAVYRCYLLEKKGIETFALLAHLAKKNKIPREEFGIAGLKDKHAITKQYITLPIKYNLSELREQNCIITEVGYLEKPIKLGDLQGNRFRITIRDIRKGELDGIEQKAATIETYGVPNYFDSQRFGSVIGQEFIAKYIIQKNYEQAAQIFLTKYTRFENKATKDEKRCMERHWPSLQNCRLQNKQLLRVKEAYLRNKDWLAAYKAIPASLREMYVNAYQSYLWNECVKEVLKKAVDKKYLYAVPYCIGSLLFYKRITTGEQERIPETFQSISDQLQAEEQEKEVVTKILAREGLTLSQFAIKEATGNFFKTAKRDMLLHPKEFHYVTPEPDECNSGRNKDRFKITVSFTLQKGSYATMITKRLFNQ